MSTLLNEVVSILSVEVFGGGRRFNANFLAPLPCQRLFSNRQQSRADAFSEMVLMHVNPG